jgi:hypothetical protein
MWDSLLDAACLLDLSRLLHAKCWFTTLDLFRLFHAFGSTIQSLDIQPEDKSCLVDQRLVSRRQIWNL